MLVLSRMAGQRIQVGDDITITVVRLTPNSVRLGIEAPRGVVILREEVIDTGQVGARGADVAKPADASPDEVTATSC